MIQPGPTPVRVAVVAPSMDVLGGQAVQADRLLEALSGASDIEATLIPINPRLPGPLRWLQRIKFVRTGVTFLAYLWALGRVLPRVDVVHVYSASYLSFVLAPTPALLFSRLLGKPTVLNYHSGEAEDHLQRWGRTAIPTLRWAGRVVVPSDYLVGVFARFGVEASVIPNSLDLARFEFRQRDVLRPAFLSNRNLEAHYGVATVLEAFALVRRQVQNATLDVAGTGSLDKPLRALSERLGGHDIRFLGRVTPEEMLALYNKADILLNASEVDNMPLSILEAQASGLPVVTSDAGGIPTIVEHGRNGLLVPPGSAADLAEQVIHLLENPDLARLLSAEGRRSIEEAYGMDEILPRWVALYRDLNTARSSLAEGSP